MKKTILAALSLCVLGSACNQNSAPAAGAATNPDSTLPKAAPVTPPSQAQNPTTPTTPATKPAAPTTPGQPTPPVTPPTTPTKPTPPTPSQSQTVLEGTWALECTKASGILWFSKYIEGNYTVVGNQSYAQQGYFHDKKCTKPVANSITAEWGTITVGPDDKKGLPTLDSEVEDSTGKTETTYNVFEIKGDDLMVGEQSNEEAKRPDNVNTKLVYVKQAEAFPIPPRPTLAPVLEDAPSDESSN